MPSALQGLDKFKLQGGTNSNIKSIQRGSVQQFGFLEQNISIQSVDPSKSIILLSFSNSQTSFFDGENNWLPEFVDGTTFKIRKPFTANGSGSWIHWQVIEFENAKVQRGTVRRNSGDGTSKDFTIQTVNQSKALLITHIVSDNTSNSGSFSHLSFGAYLFNSSTIRLGTNYNWTSLTVDMNYQVVEF